MTQPTGEDPLAALKPYVQIASGLVGISAAKAAEMAQGFLGSGADEVVVDVASSTVSVDEVRAVAREEVDRAARRLGFVREDELASMRREIDRLGRTVEELGDVVSAMSSGLSVQSENPAKKSKKKSKSKGGQHGTGSSA
jgi:hypothetical protein